MKIKNNDVNLKNIDEIYDIINDSYNINNFIINLFDKIFYKNTLLGKKILYLSNKEQIIGILIYSVNTFKKNNLVIIEELCVTNKYKSMGYSKILLKEFLKIVLKYNNCYLVSIICDLRTVSNILEKYEVIYPKINIKQINNNKIVYNAYNLIKKWYMVNLYDNCFIYIPFYTNKESFTFFNSKNIKLNKNQKELKKFIINNNYTLGYGTGILNLIKLT